MPDAPVTAAPVREMETLPTLQIIGKMKDTLRGRAIDILTANREVESDVNGTGLSNH